MIKNIEEIYAYVAELEKFGYTLCSKPIHETPGGISDTKAYAVLILIRTLSNARAAVRLLRAEQIVEARTIVRCIWDNLFTVSALTAQGDKFVEQMRRDARAAKKARGELVLQHTAAIGEQEWKKRIREFLAKMGKEQTKEKTLNPQTVAKLGSFVQGYTYFAELSADAHPTIESLERYFVATKENGELVAYEIDINPPMEEHEVKATAWQICDAVMGVCTMVAEALDEPAYMNAMAVAMERYAQMSRLYIEGT